MKDFILHICPNYPHIVLPFIDFINDNFDGGKHIFYIMGAGDGDRGKGVFDGDSIVVYSKSLIGDLVWKMNHAGKIIMHGLFSARANQLLLLQPWLFKRTYWVAWGGDFYFPEQQPWIRKQVIRNIKHCISNDGDYQLIQKEYSLKGKQIFSLMYPSNLFFPTADENPARSNTTNILIGNSASESNNHIKAFQMIEKYKEDDIQVFVPLSYGDNGSYSEKVIEEGYRIFRDKFEPILEYMPFEKYASFLNRMDIAVMNHNRQQAFGNIVKLLGMGKIVYMNSNTSSFSLLKQYGLEVFDINSFSLDKKILKQNMEIIKSKFSTKTLIKQLNQIF